MNFHKIINQLKRGRIDFLHTMNKPKVLLTRPDIPTAALNILENNFELTKWSNNSPASREFILKNISGKDGVYCFLSDKIDKELLNTAGESLKVVSTFSVGFDHIDTAECRDRHIRIGYTPDVLTEATAELTMALLLCTSRRIIESYKEAITGRWKTWFPSYMTGPGLEGSTAGIVGFGRIGQSVAKKIKAFNTKEILYYNRSEKPEAKDLGAKRTSFEDLLEISDFVICCLPLSPDTRNIFNREAFSKMKSTAIFINTSRGGLVDQDALNEALKNGSIRAAGLDVTNPEPLPTDSPLFQLSNCVILPHIGSATIEAREAMGILAAENLVAGLQGKGMPAELLL